MGIKKQNCSKKCDLCKHCNGELPFAYRPVVPGTEKGIPKHAKVWLTEIERIVNFRHKNAVNINYEHEVPEGEGQFLVRWKGRKQEDWIEGDDCFLNGISAVRKFFEDLRRRRDTHANAWMNRIPHISSLNDIVCGGIVSESDTEYKIKLAGLSKDFVYELDHPKWGKKITRLFDIIRENGVNYIWVNRIQAQYIFRKTVAEYERKKRVEPTPEEIEKMSKIEYEVYQIRKDNGYYYYKAGEEMSEDTDSHDEGSIDVVN